MLKIIKTCASIPLLCFSNYFMHLSPAPASSLHLDFPTMRGDIFGFFGCLVGLVFSFVSGWVFCLFFFPFILFGHVFSCRWLRGRCKSSMMSMWVPRNCFPKISNTRKRLSRSWLGAAVFSAALCGGSSMQICPSCPSILLFYGWSQENQPQSDRHGEVQRWPGTLVGVIEFV